MSLARKVGTMARICLDGANLVNVTGRELEARARLLREVYEDAHGGAPAPDLSIMDVGNPFRADVVELGALVAVTYKTRKGKRKKIHDWEHCFGDNPRGLLPVLGYTASARKLIVLGGDYTVTDDGWIEG